MKLTIRTGLTAVLTAAIGGFLALTIANRTLAQTINRPGFEQVAKLKPGLSHSLLLYKMKRLEVSVVDYEPLDKKFQQGGFFSTYYGSGSAFIALTADDTPTLPENVEPTFTLYPDKGNDAFLLLPNGPTFASHGAAWYEYRGSYALHKGGRALISYNKKTGMIKVMLASVMVNTQTEGVVNGVSNGVFVLHIELNDNERKVCYYGDAMIRVYGYALVNKVTPLLQAMNDMDRVDNRPR